LKFKYGGKLVVSSGSTVIINGNFEAGIYQIFSGAGGIRFGAAIKSEYYPQWWGAKGNGKSDDTFAIQSAVYSGKGRLVKFSDGIFIISAPIILASNNRLAGAPGTVLKAVASIPTILQLSKENVADNTSGFGIQDMIIDGNNLALSGVSIDSLSMANFDALSGVSIRYCLGNGLVLNRCKGAIFSSLRLDNNGGHGLTVSGCDAARFYGITARYNKLNGILVSSETNFSGGCYFYGILCEGNAQDGIGIYSVRTPILISGGWIEHNARDGIRLENSMGSVFGLRVSGVGTGSNYAVNIISGGPYFIRDCFLARESGSVDGSYAGGNGVNNSQSHAGNVIWPNINGAYNIFPPISNSVKMPSSFRIKQ
jgi:hypothetical protein